MARNQFKVTFTNAQPAAPVSVLLPQPEHVYSSATATKPVGGKQLYLDGTNTITIWSDAQDVIVSTLDGVGSGIQGTATVTSPTVTVSDGTPPASPPGSAAYVASQRNVSTAVFLGNSFTAHGIDANGDYADGGWWVWLQALASQRLTLGNIAGVAGQRIDQYTARVTTDVNPFNPGWVFIDGPTNDITQGFSLATIKTNYIALLAALAGRQVVAYTCPPNNTNDATKNAVKDQFNDWLRQLASTQTPEAMATGLIVAEVHNAVIDPASATSQWVAALTSDGTHPSPDGAVLMANVIYNAISPYLPGSIPRGSIGADSLNLCGTAGSFVTPAAGLAASWSLVNNGTGATPTTTPRTDNVQGNWQQVVVVNGTTTTQLFLRPAGWAVGDTLFGQADLIVDALGDAAALATYYGLRITMLGAAGTPSVWYLSSLDGAQKRSTIPGSKLTLKTRSIVVPTGTTNVQIGLIMFGGGTFRWGRASIRKV